MTSITIELSEDRMKHLQQLAAEAKMPPEELLRGRVEEWLSGPSKEFLQAAPYVLQKNAALYRRLA